MAKKIVKKVDNKDPKKGFGKIVANATQKYGSVDKAKKAAGAFFQKIRKGGK